MEVCEIEHIRETLEKGISQSFVYEKNPFGLRNAEHINDDSFITAYFSWTANLTSGLLVPLPHYNIKCRLLPCGRTL